MTSPASILIVDDLPANLHLLRLILTKHGLVTHLALNGRQALEKAAAEVIDLILLDVQMPEMNGFEVFAHLQENEKKQAIPVIFVSASTRVEDKVKAFKLGAADYILRPFHREELLARIDHQLSLQALENKTIQNSKRQQKRFFQKSIRSVSQDLKSPLSSIRLSTQLLEYHERLSPDERRRYLQTIHQQLDRLTNLVHNLSDLTRTDIHPEEKP